MRTILSHRKVSLPRQAIALLKGAHLLGLSLFAGGVVASIMMDRAAETGSLEALAETRRAVSVVGHSVIMPGLALAVATGCLVAFAKFGLRWHRWVCAKVFIAALILGISQIMVMPALNAATLAAIASAEQGQRLLAYDAALNRESGFGALNMALFLLAGGVALCRPLLRLARKSVPA
jgi:hypothetical protein